MIRHIVGKHKSAQEFSDIDFSALDSVGLNEAALVYNTKFAMTGHDCIFPKLKGRKIIVTLPSFEGTDWTSEADVVGHIKQAAPAHVLKREPETVTAIEDALMSALYKVDRAYPNYWTILHLAIFHAILNGYRRIFVYGCNHEAGCLPDYQEGQFYEYVEEHTLKIIDVAKRIGIEIVRFKSRKEYDSYQNKSGKK